MLDITGNNLANVNTTAYKSSRVNFSDMMSSTLRDASAPTASVGGTNPMQVGSGVQVASISRDMSQGSLMNTGQPLDMAIDGAGYFVLNDGKMDVYTRVGAFAIDGDYYLVDPSTGARVQRVGTQGVADGFQAQESKDIRIPYDVGLQANATQNISYGGNLSADLLDPTTNLIASGIRYTADQTVVDESTLLTDLSQASGLVAGDKLVLGGTLRDGTAIADTDFEIFDGSGDSKTMGDLLDAIQALYPDADVSLSDGNILVRDQEAGYSKTDLSMTFSTAGDGSLEVPKYFKIVTAGGQAVKNTSLDIYDSQGTAQTLSASFVKTDTLNTWDLVITSVTGDMELLTRRIDGITFAEDGSFAGVTGDATSFEIKGIGDTQEIYLNLGTVTKYDGLSQMGGASTVTPGHQDGYAGGQLSSLSVGGDGVLEGLFTNGIRRDIASIKLATFQNPSGLTSLGGNYYTISANSGDPTTEGVAGTVQGGSLEKSNVQTANEFINLIAAQNGYQVNARTIKVATEMVTELVNLIR
jgi:flagellar hook protein FlgE